MPHFMAEFMTSTEQGFKCISSLNFTAYKTTEQRVEQQQANFDNVKLCYTV